MILDSTLLLCLLVVILVIILLIIQGVQHSRMRRSMRAMESRVMDALDELAQQQADQDAMQREELLRSLHQLNDSLISTIGHFSRAQGDQVNAALRQSYESAQAMQRMVDDGIKRMEGRMENQTEVTSRSLSQNEQRVENLRRTVDESLRLMREDNAKRLGEMRATVDEKLNETLEKRLASSFSQVSERLEQVYRSLGEMHTLATGVGDLKRMLSNVKTRGVWGEIQLGALLEQALTDSQYQTNVAVVPGSSERVEFAVCLPGRDGGSMPVYLPIDSKFPQEDYARLAEASQSGDQAAVEAAQKALLNAVRTEAKRIGKYIAPPHTTDFAVMFLPLESLYAEVMRHSVMVESIQREQRVLISGPSTLLALLNSLQMGFRTLAIEQRSAEVWKLLGAVKGDFGAFAGLLQKTQEKLQQATDSIDTAFTKTRTIEKRLRRVEALESTEARQILEEGE